MGSVHTWDVPIGPIGIIGTIGPIGSIEPIGPIGAIRKRECNAIQCNATQ